MEMRSEGLLRRLTHEEHPDQEQEIRERVSLGDGDVVFSGLVFLLPALVTAIFETKNATVKNTRMTRLSPPVPR